MRRRRLALGDGILSVECQKGQKYSVGTAPNIRCQTVVSPTVLSELIEDRQSQNGMRDIPKCMGQAGISHRDLVLSHALRWWPRMEKPVIVK